MEQNGDKRKNGAVTWWEDWLSARAEKNSRLFRFLGRLESWVHGDDLAGHDIERPIYVCGLARSGSTILLEFLASHPLTVSHRYRDFPFVHIPIWWNSFVDRAAEENPPKVERFHKDRIMVNSESPEAMEEPLWTSFFPWVHDPGQCNAIPADFSAPAFERFYRDHIRKILSIRGGSRYLAKGNYNLARMPYLLKLFPDARFVVPVRHPVSHLASLLKQHRLFTKWESEDRRVLNHMRRMGHFEFGLDLRPLNLGDLETTPAAINSWQGNGEAVEGWALYWASVHEYLARLLNQDEHLRRAVLVVDHDELCGRPTDWLSRIARHCGLDYPPGKLSHWASRISRPAYYSHDFTTEELERIGQITGEARAAIRDLARGGVVSWPGAGQTAGDAMSQGALA